MSIASAAGNLVHPGKQTGKETYKKNHKKTKKNNPYLKSENIYVNSGLGETFHPLI